MTANAPITPNNTRRPAVPRRAMVRVRRNVIRALTITVLVIILVLPVTGLISAVGVGHPARVEEIRLDYHHTTYSLPHLPHTTDTLLEGWEKYPRGLFV